MNKNERAHGKPASSFNEIIFFLGGGLGNLPCILGLFSEIQDTLYIVRYTLPKHYTYTEVVNVLQNVLHILKRMAGLGRTHQ